MEKITFENLPSTKTPINATNLNQLQTNIENAYEKHIVSALGTQQTIEANVETKISLSNPAVIGNKLSLVNNGIVIGSGVSWVRVSANVGGQNSSANSGKIYACIKRNDEAQFEKYSDTNTAQYEYQSFEFAPFILSVNEGDVIAMYVTSPVKWVVNSSYDKMTSLMVEVIE